MEKLNERLRVNHKMNVLKETIFSQASVGDLALIKNFYNDNFEWVEVIMLSSGKLGCKDCDYEVKGDWIK